MPHWVEIDGEVISTVPTPDGRSLIVSQWAKGDSRVELLRVALGGSRTDTLVSPTASNVVRPMWPRVSPDGRLVAFGDYDLSPDGRTFVAVTPITTHTRVFAAYNWAEEMRREWKAGSRK